MSRMSELHAEIAAERTQEMDEMYITWLNEQEENDGSESDTNKEAD